MKELIVEVRNPKAEGRKQSEGRRPNTEPVARGGFRNSGFFRYSEFGLRASSAVIGVAVLFAGFAPAPVSAQAAIPDRPEKLTFPPLVYEPPAPANYRVQLKSGPIAYVAPDRELPLVNLVVYVHTGSYLEPAGKEGLAELVITVKPLRQR